LYFFGLHYGVQIIGNIGQHLMIAIEGKVSDFQRL